MNTMTTQPAVLTEARPRAAMLTKEQIIANREVVRDVMANVMKQGIHYGTIPGTDKPTLFKPGSEVLLSTFRIATSIRVEDLSTEDCIRYRVFVTGTHSPSGIEMGHGVGEASTDEEKYKWRRAVSINEFEATDSTRKRIKYYRDGTGTQVRTNPADLGNTVLKMGKKRAQIDFTLTALAVSDLFNQDLEDLAEELRESVVSDGEPAKPNKSGTSAPKAKAKEPAVQTAEDPTAKITPEQLKKLRQDLDKAGIPEKSLYQRCKVMDFADLQQGQLSDIEHFISRVNNPE